MRPRCRPGIRSAMATYRKLAAASARKYRQERGQAVERDERCNRACGARKRREHVEHQRPAAGVAGVQQDGEIANLLRDLVGRHGNRCADAERDRRHDGRGDDGTVDEVVERVANEHGKYAALVHFAVVRVAVSPENKLFEDEEQKNAEQQRAEDLRRGKGFEGGRQQAQHRHAKQRTHRVADEPGNELRSRVVLDEQDSRCDEQTTDTADKTQPNCDEEGRHAQRL